MPRKSTAATPPPARLLLVFHCVQNIQTIYRSCEAKKIIKGVIEKQLERDDILYIYIYISSLEWTGTQNEFSTSMCEWSDRWDRRSRSLVSLTSSSTSPSAPPAPPPSSPSMTPARSLPVGAHGKNTNEGRRLAKIDMANKTGYFKCNKKNAEFLMEM